MTVTAEVIESGDPAKDAQAFRRCLGAYPTGVAIVTVGSGDELAAITVNSFASLSLDPPLILWAIGRNSSRAGAFLAARHFSVSVLSSGQADIARAFSAAGSKLDDIERWAGGAGGAPLLKGAAAHFECALENALEGGDHTILIGRVKRFTRFAGEPLVFSRGRYAGVRALER